MQIKILKAREVFCRDDCSMTVQFSEPYNAQFLASVTSSGLSVCLYVMSAAQMRAHVSRVVTNREEKQAPNFRFVCMTLLISHRL